MAISQSLTTHQPVMYDHHALKPLSSQLFPSTAHYEECVLCSCFTDYIIVVNKPLLAITQPLRVSNKSITRS